MYIKIALLFICLFFSQIISAKDQLIFAIDMIRHGDRTPLHVLNENNYPWTVGPGQLTPLGMEQQLALGTKLRQRYVFEEKLLPELYKAETLYIRSTDYDRTLMSAQAFLLGLYPLGTGPMPCGFQPIPIHSNPKETDSLLPNETHEKQFHALLNKLVYPSPEWKAKVDQTKPKWAQWSKLSGKKIESLGDIIRLGNILFIYQLYDAPLPANMSKQDIDTIIEISHWGLAAKYRPKEIGSFLGKEPLKIITNYLAAASKKESSVKYVLLSAHDSSLLSLMSALGAPLDTAPPYASHLSFGLYENAQKEHYIVVSFNDKPITLPGCNPQGCTLNQLTEKLI